MTKTKQAARQQEARGRPAAPGTAARSSRDSRPGLQVQRPEALRKIRARVGAVGAHTLGSIHHSDVQSDLALDHAEPAANACAHVCFGRRRRPTRRDAARHAAAVCCRRRRQRRARRRHALHEMHRAARPKPRPEQRRHAAAAGRARCAATAAAAAAARCAGARAARVVQQRGADWLCALAVARLPPGRPARPAAAQRRRHAGATHRERQSALVATMRTARPGGRRGVAGKRCRRNASGDAAAVACVAGVCRAQRVKVARRAGGRPRRVVAGAGACARAHGRATARGCVGAAAAATAAAATGLPWPGLALAQGLELQLSEQLQRAAPTARHKRRRGRGRRRVCGTCRVLLSLQLQVGQDRRTSRGGLKAAWQKDRGRHPGGKRERR
eukprot:70281-Chlamydomonas_euryale.AAC.4